MVPVGYLQNHTASAGFVRRDFDRLINLLHLPIFGRKRPVGSDDAFKAKRPKVRDVSEISTVRNELLTVAAFLVKPLVAPFPNETAEQSRVRVDLVPIILEVADGVAHGMGVLTCEDWSMIEGRGRRGALQLHIG